MLLVCFMPLNDEAIGFVNTITGPTAKKQPSRCNASLNSEKLLWDCYVCNKWQSNFPVTDFTLCLNESFTTLLNTIAFLCLISKRLLFN